MKFKLSINAKDQKEESQIGAKFSIRVDSALNIISCDKSTINTLRFLTRESVENGQSLSHIFEKHEFNSLKSKLNRLTKGEFMTFHKRFPGREDNEHHFQLLFQILKSKKKIEVEYLIEGYNITNQIKSEIISGKSKFEKGNENTVPETRLDLLCKFRTDGTITYSNRDFTRTFLIGNSSSAPIRFPDLLNEVESKEFELILKSITGNRPHNFWMKGLKGNIKEAIQWTIFGFEGKPDFEPEFVAIGRNIFEERRKEIESINYKNKIGAILEAIPDMLFVFNKSGTILDCYSNDESLLLSKPEHIKGFNIRDFFPEKIAEEIAGIIKSCINNRKIIPYVYSVEVNGNKYTFEARHVPMDRNKVLSISRNITEKLVAEEKLKESEERFRLISENTSDGVIVINNQNIEFASKSYLKILGYSNQEEIGRSEREIFELIHPEDRENVRKVIFNAISQKLPDITYLYRARAKTGQYIWREDHATLLYDENGSYFKAYVVCRDVSERLSLMEQLSLKEERLRLVVEVSEAGVWDWNLKTDKVVHNETWCNHLTLDNSYLEHDIKFFNSLIFPEDRDKVFNKIQDCLYKGIPFFSEHRMITRDDKTIWVIDRGDVVERDKAGMPVRMMGSFINITDHKLNNKKASILEQAIEQSPNVLIITSKNGTIEYINPQFSRTTGYSKDEILGKNVKILKSGYHSKEFYSELWTTISEGKTWRGDFHNKDKNGRFYWEKSIIFPVINNEKEIVQFIAIKEDITKQKELWDQLLEAKLRAEESDRLKSAFLANISHEIRTPLNGILGFTSLLGNDSITSDERKKFTGIINMSGEKLLHVVDDLIEISRIEAGQLVLSENLTNINKIIRCIQEKYKEQICRKKLEFFIENGRPDNYAFILTDVEKLTRILDNLVNNAIKFSRLGGIIRVGYSILNTKIELFVQDTGIGINERYRDLIFKSFRQIETGASRNYGGMGLGLSIAKGYIHFLKGEIWLNSEIEKGTHIVFTIPYKPNDNEKLHKERPTISKKLLTKVLIVDDESANVEYFKIILEAMVPQTFVAENGMEAVLLTESEFIPLIFMDIKMPVMDGVEAMKRIKSKHPNSFIVAVTSFALEGDRESFVIQGFDDYLKKPFDDKDIKTLVEKHFILNYEKLS